MRIFRNFFRLLRHEEALPRAAVAAAAAMSTAEAFACLAELRNISGGDSKHEHFPEFPRLPPEHPDDTIRVRRIAGGIIAAAWDDEIVGQRRLSDRTRHASLKKCGDMKVNVSVIDDSKQVEAGITYFGIVIFTGMLDYIREDDNYIATVLSHGCIAMVLTDRILINFVEELLEVPPGDEITQEAWEALFIQPHRIRSEFEADRIGLLLQSAAGYDPRVAPALCLKLLEDKGEDDINSTHPSTSSKRRAQALSQPEIMGEALELYNTVSGRVAQTKSGIATLAPQAPLQ